MSPDRQQKPGSPLPARGLPPGWAGAIMLMPLEWAVSDDYVVVTSANGKVAVHQASPWAAAARRRQRDEQ